MTVKLPMFHLDGTAGDPKLYDAEGRLITGYQDITVRRDRETGLMAVSIVAAVAFGPPEAGLKPTIRPVDAAKKGEEE